MEQEELKRMRRLVFKTGLGSKLYQLDLDAWFAIRNTLNTSTYFDFSYFMYTFWPYLSPHILNEKFVENFTLRQKLVTIHIFLHNAAIHLTTVLHLFCSRRLFVQNFTGT